MRCVDGELCFTCFTLPCPVAMSHHLFRVFATTSTGTSFGAASSAPQSQTTAPLTLSSRDSYDGKGAPLIATVHYMKNVRGELGESYTMRCCKGVVSWGVHQCSDAPGRCSTGSVTYHSNTRCSTTTRSGTESRWCTVMAMEFFWPTSRSHFRLFATSSLTLWCKKQRTSDVRGPSPCGTISYPTSWLIVVCALFVADTYFKLDWKESGALNEGWADAMGNAAVIYRDGGLRDVRRSIRDAGDTAGVLTNA